MPDATAGRLQALVREVCGQVDVFFGLPKADESHLQVCLALVGFAPNAALRNDSRAPLQIYRRYLALATGPDQEARTGLVEPLLFKCLDSADVQLETETIPDSFWLAVKLAPQPAFLLRVPVVKERPQKEPRRVETVEVKLSQTRGPRPATEEK